MLNENPNPSYAGENGVSGSGEDIKKKPPMFE